MQRNASWTLTTAEARAHVETLTLAMDLLTRRYPDQPTALVYGRLRDLKELLERGAEEPPNPADHWGRPLLCGECDNVLPGPRVGMSPWLCEVCRHRLLATMGRL